MKGKIHVIILVGYIVSLVSSKGEELIIQTNTKVTRASGNSVIGDPISSAHPS